MKIISKVKNLTRHDLIYVFEKMKIGEDVDLNPDEKNNCTWVIYKDHKIGNLDYIDFDFFGFGKKVKAKINSISLNKYFPFENLDIEIKPTF
jgi:hypothetical protein